MLLILDSFESLLTHSTNTHNGVDDEVDILSLLTDILKAAPNVKLLITTRIRLNLQQEMIIPVRGLTYPEVTSQQHLTHTKKQGLDVTQYSAVELFIISAQRINPDFSPTKDNQQDIIRICQLVNGLPFLSPKTSITFRPAWAKHCCNSRP